jgi:radical SAM superfamily enzyme
VGVHVILGLPGESPDDMRATARELARLAVHSVKLHNLYAVRNTVLADQVAAGKVRLPEFAEYVGYAVDFLEELPEEVVIDRLCGDAPPEYLVGPSWCLNKAALRAAVEAEFQRRGTRQGSRVVDTGRSCED